MPADAQTQKQEMTQLGKDVAKVQTGLGSAGSFSATSDDGVSQKLVDEIEMMEEESAARLSHAPTGVTPGMRYLHSSRTIHQLITDRNKAVGIYLAVASLLLTASGAVMNVRESVDSLVPIRVIQRWCLPTTFAVLTGLALFMALILIRTRVGLIYEVAKMNALLGLPVVRVTNLSPLSIFFIMQALLSAGGGFSAGMFAIFLLHAFGYEGGWVAVIGFAVGAVVCAALILCYALTIKTIILKDKFKPGG